jgi:hypothetical protein
MSIESLPKASSRTSQAAVEHEALKIAAAIEHIKAHGNLDGFPAGRGERLALVSTAGRQGLIGWNRSRARYELTSRGHRHVRAMRRAGRNALRKGQGGMIRSGMNAIVTTAGAVVVLGAVFLAFNPTGPANLAAEHQGGAYFTSGATAPARGQAPQGKQPRAVTAVPVIDSKQVSTEQLPAMPANGPVEGPDASASVQPGQAARALAARVPSEPEIATGAAAKKVADGHHEVPEAAKPAQKHKRSARRRDTLSPGYAYAPYAGSQYGPYGATGSYRYWSGPAWSFR